MASPLLLPLVLGTLFLSPVERIAEPLRLTGATPQVEQNALVDPVDRSVRATEWAWCNSMGKRGSDNAAVYTETFRVPSGVVEARIRVQFIRWLDANMTGFAHESTRCFFPYATAALAGTALSKAKALSRSRGIRTFGSYRSFVYVTDR